VSYAGGQEQQFRTEYLSTRRIGGTGGKEARMRNHEVDWQIKALSNFLARATCPAGKLICSCRDLSRGGNSRPRRRTTSSSGQPAATSGSNRKSICRWLSMTESPPTATEEIRASPRSRLPIQT